MEYDNGSYVCYIADEYLSVLDESEYRTLSQQEIEVMCAKHVLWLNDEGGEQADFSGCLIRNVDLSRMKLSSAKFDGAQLENVSFRGAELCFASMNGISLYKCNLSSLAADECSTKNAKAVSCQLDNSIFTHSNLTGAMFRECSLANTHLMNCCIDGTDFGDASLSSVDLHGVSSNETEWASEAFRYLNAYNLNKVTVFGGYGAVSQLTLGYLYDDNFDRSFEIGISCMDISLQPEWMQLNPNGGISRCAVTMML